jgi:hypothetical protein
MKRAILPALVFSALLACAAGARTATPLSESARVSTLAGNGSAGLLDAAGNAADLVFPVAGAYDKRDGSAYVADLGAQRIRRVARDGSVTTAAGSGPLLPSGLAVAGGYADGPAAQARFNLPSGIAVAADGTVYVADAFNHCIRKIANGVVSTYTGDPHKPGNFDGALNVATFIEPRGLALASDGTLYVADFTVGVRQISPDGNVSTLGQIRRDTTALALWEDERGTLLYTASRTDVGRYDPDADTYLRFKETRQRPRGMAASGIVALGRDRVAVSSVTWHDVWYVRFPNALDPSRAFSRLLAGQDEKDWQQNGGFADGTPERAAFYDPMQMARDGRGDILLADAGNRRIRVLPAVVTQAALEPGRPLPPARAAAFHILIVGGSSEYSNAMPEDSIGAELQRRLNAGRAQFGPGRPVEVRSVDLGATALPGQAAYLAAAVRHADADLVVWSFDSQALGTGPAERFLNGDAEFAAELMRDAARAQPSRGVRLTLALHPLGSQLAASEATVYQLRRLPPESVAAGGDAYRALEKLAASSGVPLVGTLPRFEEAERGVHLPLFAPDHDDLTPSGNALYGEALAAALQRLRPW